MPSRNVNLTEHLDRFIEAGITSGRFSNASEVVREGLQGARKRVPWIVTQPLLFEYRPGGLDL